MTTERKFIILPYFFFGSTRPVGLIWVIIDSGNVVAFYFDRIRTLAHMAVRTRSRATAHLIIILSEYPFSLTATKNE